MGNSLVTYDEEVFDLSNASNHLRTLIVSGELEDDVVGQSLDTARGKYPQYEFRVVRKYGKFLHRTRTGKRNRINVDITTRGNKEIIRCIHSFG
jgi:hypothetical protein